MCSRQERAVAAAGRRVNRWAGGGRGRGVAATRRRVITSGRAHGGSSSSRKEGDRAGMWEGRAAAGTRREVSSSNSDGLWCCRFGLTASELGEVMGGCMTLRWGRRCQLMSPYARGRASGAWNVRGAVGRKDKLAEESCCSCHLGLNSGDGVGEASSSVQCSSVMGNWGFRSCCGSGSIYADLMFCGQFKIKMCLCLCCLSALEAVVGLHGSPSCFVNMLPQDQHRSRAVASRPLLNLNTAKSEDRIPCILAQHMSADHTLSGKTAHPPNFYRR